MPLAFRLMPLALRFAACCALLAMAAYGAAGDSSADCVLRPGAILRIVLAPGSPASPKPAAVFAGALGRAVYSEGCQVLPQGMKVRAAVDRIEKPHEKLFPFGWIQRAAGKRGEPPAVFLRSVELQPPAGAPIPVKTSFLRVETERHLEASRKALSKAGRARMLLLRVEQPMPSPNPVPGPREVGGMLAAGTRIRVDLGAPVSSSKNREGDIIRARVSEPVIAGGRIVVPEGAVFDGVVGKSRRAPRPYRSGRLRLSFQALRLASGPAMDAPAGLTAGDFSAAADMDPEGGLSGGPLDRKRALLNAGLAYLTGKILDDSLEESAKAVMGAAVAGSAATAARYVGLTSGVLVFLLHRGRDVSLYAHTELELTFSRDVQLQIQPLPPLAPSVSK